MIYPNEHRPAHAHVIGDGEAVFILNCPDGPPELRESYRFDRSDLARIETGLADHIAELCTEWRKFHGYY
ncbi:DUF4160 domain-containing protein [Acidithiobacillus sp. M4-SHS-6]|uniref:DUF4160 domain-containing protein n=1 Tax=Acidithiobacillus sp. M4-SHS-6 TaxID=3383024 RepID=UPI0039BEA353